MQSVISFNSVISHLTSEFFATGIAAKNSLNAAQEHYHLQMAIHEHGEKKVVQEVAEILKDRYRCSYSEAVADAGNRVRAALEITEGIKTFQEARVKLNNQ